MENNFKPLDSRYLKAMSHIILIDDSKKNKLIPFQDRSLSWFGSEDETYIMTHRPGEMLNENYIAAYPANSYLFHAFSIGSFVFHHCHN